MKNKPLNEVTKGELKSLVRKFSKKGLKLYDTSGKVLGFIVKISVDKHTKRAKSIVVELESGARKTYSAEKIEVNPKKGFILVPKKTRRENKPKPSPTPAPQENISQDISYTEVELSKIITEIKSLEEEMKRIIDAKAKICVKYARNEISEAFTQKMLVDLDRKMAQLTEQALKLLPYTKELYQVLRGYRLKLVKEYEEEYIKAMLCGTRADTQVKLSYLKEKLDRIDSLMTNLQSLERLLKRVRSLSTSPVTI